ncbi:hypothetical protein J6500_25450 [Bradyrhizobium sp. WSM 1704]|uniref:hypothetical protein n=1 Tax=Bradyrhizobium semiaridum TaxID=2821404 RepID=UPI001CE3AABA|nr:hypothetical protein [Bradyrhizobium semiaridum]MCA6125215.1 hypothetical protein [Bradyrhizobium semiaridum]
MKKLLIAVAATLMCGSAFAQATGPQPQTDTMQKPGTNRMERDSMRPDRGSVHTGTTGMSRRGMQPDASGQGGSGPGSDQGGTRVPPKSGR